MNLAPIDRHLLGCLSAAGGGECSLLDLFTQALADMHPIEITIPLFAHRSAQRLQQAGLIERDGDRIKLTAVPVSPSPADVPPTSPPG